MKEALNQFIATKSKVSSGSQVSTVVKASNQTKLSTSTKSSNQTKVPTKSPKRVKIQLSRSPKIARLALLIGGIALAGVFIFFGASKLESQKHNLQQEVAKAEQKQEVAEKTLVQTHQALDELTAVVVTKNKVASEAIKKVEENQEKLNNLQTQTQSLQDELGRLREENDALTKEKEELAAKIQLQALTEKKKNEVSILSANSQSKSSAKVGEEINVLATAYTAECKGCSGITATGIDVRRSTPNIIAVDPRIIPLHSTVEVWIDGELYGTYSAQDKGKDIKGRRIDILFDKHSDAISFGTKDAVVKVIKYGNSDPY